MADTVTGPEVLQENDKRVALKIVVESVNASELVASV